MAVSKPKALHFGAGNIGRGFIGPLLVESDYHVVFADIDTDVISALNERKSYSVHTIGEKKRPKLVTSISGVLIGANNDDVIHELADPATRIVTTAVGVNVLGKLASTIARGLQARRKADAGSLNVIACENMVRQTDELSRLVFQHLPPEDQSWVDKHIGFANCSVDRIVPPGEPKRGSLDVYVEEFHEWIVDEAALRSPIDPKVKGMALTSNLDAYVERKLFTLNCGHAITAYMGFIRQYRTVDEAILDPHIRNVVHGAMHESGAALIKKHDFDHKAHSEYIESILVRIADPNLGDSVTRVGRQPLRKLSKKDRLLGPTNLAKEYGLPVDNLARGIAAAFAYAVKDDEQSVELQEKVKRIGIAKAVADTTELWEGTEEHSKVVDAYRELHN